MRYADLPAIGSEIDGGAFAGLTTRAGAHCAVVALKATPGAELTHAAASDWAASVGGALPTRAVWLMLASELPGALLPRWHWTCEAAGRESAYIGCIGSRGGCAPAYVGLDHHAVAVRLIPLTA